MQHYPAHTDAVTDISFHPSGNYLASASDDTSLKIWDLREGHLFYTLNGHEGATTSVCFSPQGDYFASGATDDQVMVWKTNFDQVLNDTPAAPVREKPKRPNQSNSMAHQQEAPVPIRAKIPQVAAAEELVDYETAPIPESASGGGADMEELPERLASTLDHIIGQLDIITRTVTIIEQRLTTNEDRLHDVEQTQSKILESLALD